MATKIGLLAQELSKLNPWWRGTGWASTDPDLRDATADGLDYRSEVLAGLQPGGLYILRGPRRVGKTVAVKQQIDALINTGTPPTSIVRLAADGWAAKDLRTVVQNTALPPMPSGQIRTWFVDEVSAVTGDWAQHIKWLRDNDVDFRDATVVLTGSNATSLTEASGALAGRRGTNQQLDRTLLPVGFRTFVRLVSQEPPPNIPPLPVGTLRTNEARDAYAGGVPWLDELTRTWELYLMYGGFPRSVAAAARGRAIPESFVEDIFNVIAGDAFKHSKLSATGEMALIERLWESMGTQANLSAIGEDIGASHDIVARHVDYLRDSYLLWRCAQKAEKHWLARERAQDKIYAIDPIVARLAHLRNPARRDVDPTVLTEMQIGMAIHRHIATTTPTVLNDDFLFHVRTPTRKEIDFVASQLAGAAIEGKYCEDGSWRGEARTVDASEWNGILCTRNVLDTSGEGAWAVPASFIAYSIDT